MHLVAQKIRSVALSVEPGEYLGSEEKFSRKFGVTGPTLRQAIRLLEHEGVIRIKRGLGGGYFADRPDAKVISGIAASYLRSNLQSIDEIGLVLQHMLPLVIRLALRSGRLQEFKPFADASQAATTYRDSIAQQSAFIELLWDVGGNAPLKLLHAICFRVGSGLETDPPNELTPGIVSLQQLRTECAQALLEHDAGRASELAVRMSRLVHGGIKENVEKFAAPLAPARARTSAEP